MDVELTPDQKAFALQAIKSGRLTCEEDAVREALSLWEERERSRAELLASLDEAEADMAAGRFRVGAPQLAEDLKREARERRQQS
jgi:Arc/MetJ-type ribon-helix-helix transcriptional regulator